MSMLKPTWLFDSNKATYIGKPNNMSKFVKDIEYVNKVKDGVTPSNHSEDMNEYLACRIKEIQFNTSKQFAETIETTPAGKAMKEVSKRGVRVTLTYDDGDLTRKKTIDPFLNNPKFILTMGDYIKLVKI